MAVLYLIETVAVFQVGMAHFRHHTHYRSTTENDWPRDGSVSFSSFMTAIVSKEDLRHSQGISWGDQFP